VTANDAVLRSGTRSNSIIERRSRRSTSVKVTFAYGYATGFRRKEPRCQTEALLGIINTLRSTSVNTTVSVAPSSETT
jgi:hypothetical protein